ncbi:MAG: tetratricopeptide repeat protein [Hyphomicrobiales bacterium]
MPRFTAFASAALVLLLALAGPAAALTSNTPDGKPAKTCEKEFYYSKRCDACIRTCPTGEIWSCTRKECVKRTSSGATDVQLYTEALSLIQESRFREALDLLHAVQNQQDPKVLNYIGYSTRKLGDVDKGLTYYHKALALDPDLNIAREYLGEGYLQKGDVASARLQLAEIEKRCGRTCHEYEELDEAINAYLAGRAPNKKDGW